MAIKGHGPSETEKYCNGSQGQQRTAVLEEEMEEEKNANTTLPLTKNVEITFICMFGGFCNSVTEESVALGHDATSMGNLIQIS
jgi:L-serine deaminase